MRTGSHRPLLLSSIGSTCLLELNALLPLGLWSLATQYGCSLMISIRPNSLRLQSLTYTNVKVGLSLVAHLVLKSESFKVTSRVCKLHPRIYTLCHALYLHVQHMLLLFLIKELVSAYGWLFDGTVLLLNKFLIFYSKLDSTLSSLKFLVHSVHKAAGQLKATLVFTYQVLLLFIVSL